MFTARYWDECEAKVVSRLSPRFFSRASVERAIGVLEVNAYELHSGSGGNSGHRGIFPLGALLSHSCVANTVITYQKESPFRATYLASTDIKKGEEVLMHVNCIGDSVK